jgi:hypothetical protein
LFSRTIGYSAVVKYLHGYAANWKEMERTYQMMISLALQLKWTCTKPPFRTMAIIFLVMVRTFESLSLYILEKLFIMDVLGFLLIGSTLVSNELLMIKNVMQVPIMLHQA